MTYLEPEATDDTPQTIADAFKQGVATVESEDQINLGPGLKQRKTKEPASTGTPPPEWDADKIGMVSVYINDAIFAAYDMPPMEEDEKQSHSETVAYYLNHRWPDGARYEPEARLAADLAGLWVPRLMAQRAAMEIDTTLDEPERE